MPINNPTLDALFPRGIRNYNPGNIQNGPFAKSQPGYVGSDGRFAQFDTMDNGLAAHSALLDSYGNKGLNTLNAIINRWAPSSDGNRPANYAAFVGKKLGIDPNQPLDMSDPNVRKNIATAMGTFENGMSPTDPRSWMASGSPQPATGAPMQLPGAVAPNTQQQGAQSISLGDEENQQPFNNIGSTLANMGASIASLDNRGTGIASLNASRVAANLAAQEAARERDDTPQLIGFNADKTMMMMRKGNQIYSVATPQGFGGVDNNNLPNSVREYNERLKNPGYADYMDNKDKLEPSLSEDTRRMYAMRAIKGDNTWTKEIGGDKQGSVDKRAIDEEQNKIAKELHLDVGDIVKARTELRYRNKVADQIALIDTNTSSASMKIDAAANNLIETSKKYPRGDIRFIESLKQKWDEQANDPNLADLKTSIDAFALDYATALNPQKKSPTVDDVRNARNKILSNMNQESLEAVVKRVQSEIGGIRANSQKMHEQFFGQSDNNKPSETPQSQNTPAPASQPISREDALAEARRRGLIK